MIQKKILFGQIMLLFFLGLFVLTPCQAQGQETQQDIRNEIEALKNQLKALEERLKTTETVQRKTVPEMKTRLGDKIEIGGELEFEFVDTHNDNMALAAKNENPRFQMDQIRLKTKISPTENIDFKFKLDFEKIEEEVEVDEAYLTFRDIGPFDQEIAFGLKDRFMGGDMIERITEGSPIARTIFWKDPDLGIQYSGKSMPFHWHVSLTNGMQLNDSDIGEDESEGINSDRPGRDDIMQDDDDNEDFNFNKQIGVGLGYQANLGEMGLLDILGFGYFSKLSNKDLLDDSVTGAKRTGMNSSNWFPGTPGSDSALLINSDRAQRRLGANVVYIKDTWETYGQYIRAQDSYLRRHVWLFQTSYKFDIDWQFLKALQPLFRYDYYMVSWPHDISAPLTWDRRRYTTALLNHIRENLILKLEYAINLEDTGGDSPNNNEFLAQLEYSF